MGAKPLTKEEQARLELQRAEAKVKLEEVGATRIHIKKIMHTYDMIWCRAWIKFTDADRRLAEADKVTVLRPTRGPRGRKRTFDEMSAEELLLLLDREKIKKLHDILSEKVVSGL